jgi:hypothetical protein
VTIDGESNTVVTMLIDCDRDHTERSELYGGVKIRRTGQLTYLSNDRRLLCRMGQKLGRQPVARIIPMPMPTAPAEYVGARVEVHIVCAALYVAYCIFSCSTVEVRASIGPGNWDSHPTNEFLGASRRIGSFPRWTPPH